MIGELIEGWLVMYLLYSRHGLLYRALIIGILLMTWMFGCLVPSQNKVFSITLLIIKYDAGDQFLDRVEECLRMK